MTEAQAPVAGARRPHWLKAAAVAWMVFVSAIAIVDSAAVGHLVEQGRAGVRPGIRDAPVQALSRRVEELGRHVDAIDRQPPPAARADLDRLRDALDERLKRVEQHQASETFGDDLRAVRTRLDAFEARLKRARPPASLPRPVAAIVPKPPEPPFVIDGVELRGGVRFLSIRPAASTSAADLRLLREGEADGAWRLQSIDGRTAVFQVDGQTRRIAIP